MKRNMLNRVLSLVLVLSMVMSFAVMPVGATEGEGGESHVHTWANGVCSDTTCNANCTHEGTEKTESVTASTCAAAGSKTVTCVCGTVISTETLALALHDYSEETGVCTGCGAQKPTEPQDEEQPAICTKDADCTAESHDVECPKHPDYVAPVTCDKTADCKATENHDAECEKAKAGAEASAQRVADVQKLIDALPEKYFAHEAEAVAAQYEACTAAIGALSDAERGELDMTKYYATATMEVAPVTDAATFNAALAAAANDAAVTIELAGNVTLDVGAHDHYALGTAANQTITIDGKGQYTLTFHNTNSDWNHIATNGATLVLKNMRITNSGHNDGPWNRHDINFACNVQLNNVTSDKALAFKAGATLNSVTVSDTGDIYAIWVQPNGQTVSINGLTVTCGRGIKIDSQYVSAPALVNLSVSNATFTTSAKSAILVNSAAGANVTLSNVNISAVAADAVNPVWVDDGSAAYYGKVTVTGGTKALEGGADGYKVVVTSGTEPVAYCDDLKTAFANAVDNATITLMDHVTATETIEVTKPVTLKLNGKTITNSLPRGRMFAVKANMTIDGTVSGSAVTGTTATSYGLANLYSANFTINGGRYAFNMNDGALIKALEGTSNLTLNNVTMETDDEITDWKKGQGCFGNVSISGCSLSSNNAAEGGGVILGSTGTVTMNNTSVSAAGCVAVEIPIAKNSTVTNCMLTSGSGDPNWALWVSRGAEVTVKGGSYTGVGVAPTGGTLTIESGTVTANNVSAWAYSGTTATVNITGGTFNTAPTKGGQGGTEIINITGGTFKKDASVIDVTAFVPVTHAQNTEGKVEPKANTNVPNAAGATKVDTSTVKNDANVDVASMGTNEAAKTTSGLDTALSQTAVNNLVKDMDTNGADKVVLNMQIDVKETQTDGTTQNVKISYDVTPVLQPVKVEETNGTTTTENVGTPKELTTVEQPITFRLPLPANTTSKYVNVWHKGVALGAFEVKGTSPNQYIELQSTTFSPWTVELLPSTVTALNVESGTNKFATVADALAAAGSNSVIKLLAAVTEDISISKSVTLDLNGQSIDGAVEVAANTNVTIINTAMHDENNENDGKITGALTVNGILKVNKSTRMVVNGLNGSGKIVVDAAGLEKNKAVKILELTGSLNFDPASIEYSNSNPDSGEAIFISLPKGENAAYLVRMDLPKASVADCENENLTFAKSFGVVDPTLDQLKHFGTWFADFEITVNGIVANTITFYNGEGDQYAGYLGGSYGDYGWIYVPGQILGVTVPAATLTKGKEFRVMAYAAEKLGQPGLAVTYNDVVDMVGNFGCGVYFKEGYLVNNPNLSVTVKLKMYDSVTGEAYSIGGADTFHNDVYAAFVDANGNGKADSGEKYATVDAAFDAVKNSDKEVSVVIKDGAADGEGKLALEDTTIVTHKDTTVQILSGGDIEYKADGTADVIPDFNSVVMHGSAVITHKENGKKVTRTYIFSEGAYLTVQADGTVKLVPGTTGEITYLNENGKYNLTPEKNNNTFVQTSAATMKFKSNMFFETFKELHLDGKKLTLNTDYTAVKGSTIITLSNPVLRKLATGNHTLTLVGKDNRTAECNVYVSPNYYADATNPKTGDDIFAPAALMLFSVSALAVLMLNKKRIF